MDIDHDQADHDQTDDDQTDDIAQFCAITNATAEVAVGYLRASGGKVEMAIQFYLESEIGDPFPSVHSSRPAVHVPSPAPRNISSSFETDEEMARRLTEEDTDRVRAPIAPKREVLFGGGGGGLAGLPSVSVPALYGNLALPAHSTRSRTGATRIFNQQEAPGSSSSGHEAFRDFAAESASSQETRRTDKAKRLADLFRPPFDIMFKDDFDSARNKARAEMKWLMVNIQNVTEFACQVMNRDLWSDLPVKELVRENFVFMQYGSESTEGKRYINLYPIDNYPHVAIIDPKTAERVKVWNTVMEPIDFIMSVTEFLDSPTAFASRMKLPVPPKKKTSKPLADMTEEEQLNAAIAASLGDELTTEPNEHSPVILSDDEEDETMDDGVLLPPSPTPVLAPEPVVMSPFESIKPVKREEPTDLKTSTRIQIRLTDGSRVLRRFSKSDPVRYLFEYVKAEVSNAQTQPFELVFNREQLIDRIDQSITEAGLENAAVNFVFA